MQMHNKTLENMERPSTQKLFTIPDPPYFRAHTSSMTVCPTVILSSPQVGAGACGEHVVPRRRHGPGQVTLALAVHDTKLTHTD